MNTRKRAALIGPTGRAGAVILSELLSNGFAVNVLIRNSDHLFQVRCENTEVFTGDATYDGVPCRLIEGRDFVINAASNTGNMHPISSSLTRKILARFIVDEMTPVLDSTFGADRGGHVIFSEDTVP